MKHLWKEEAVSAVDELRVMWGPLDPAADDRDHPDAETRRSTLESILLAEMADPAARAHRRELIWTADPAAPPHRRELIWTADPAAPARRRELIWTTSGRRLSRRWVLGAGAGATALAVAVGIAVASRPRPPGGPVATPVLLSYQLPSGGPGARVRLARIAAAAAASRTPRPSGLPEHLRIASWSLDSLVDDKQVTSAVVPVDVETWRAADGSGKRVQRYAEPQFRNAADRQAWHDAGNPGGAEQPTTDTFGPGELVASWPDRLPTDAAAAARWLTHGNPIDDPGSVFHYVVDLLHEQVLTPAERATVLRVVAALPGLKYLGAVRERAGRTGAAFAVDSAYSGLPGRYTLIVNPADGQVLGFEYMLTTDAGRLNVSIPAVIEYDTYLVADHAAIG
jgi:hypothetical protein